MPKYEVLLDMGQAGDATFEAADDDEAWGYALGFVGGGDWSDFYGEAVNVLLRRGGKEIRNEAVGVEGSAEEA